MKKLHVFFIIIIMIISPTALTGCKPPAPTISGDAAVFVGVWETGDQIWTFRENGEINKAYAKLRKL